MRHAHIVRANFVRVKHFSIMGRSQRYDSLMRHLIAALAVLVAGCVAPRQEAQVSLEERGDALAIEHCRLMVERELVAPGSMKMVRSVAIRRAELEVSLTFDSQNAFGALLRGEASCHYPLPLLADDSAFWPSSFTLNGKKLAASGALGASGDMLKAILAYRKDAGLPEPPGVTPSMK